MSKQPKYPRSRAAALAMIKVVREECKTDVETEAFLQELEWLYIDRVWRDDGTIEAARRERLAERRARRAAARAHGDNIVTR